MPRFRVRQFSIYLLRATRFYEGVTWNLCLQQSKTLLSRWYPRSCLCAGEYGRRQSDGHRQRLGPVQHAGGWVRKTRRLHRARSADGTRLPQPCRELSSTQLGTQAVPSTQRCEYHTKSKYLPEVLHSWRSYYKDRDNGVTSEWLPYVTGTARVIYL